MKKVLSIVLLLTVLFSVIAPATQAQSPSDNSRNQNLTIWCWRGDRTNQTWPCSRPPYPKPPILCHPYLFNRIRCLPPYPPRPIPPILLDHLQLPPNNVGS